jgi:hypothetical protein
MHKSGLLALADTYGLDRRELLHLKLLAEGFFDELREQLASCAGTSIKLSGMVQSISSFKEVCAGVPATQLIFLGSDKGVAALVKVDAAFARALVDCVISGRTSHEAHHIRSQFNSVPAANYAARSPFSPIASPIHRNNWCWRILRVRSAAASELSSWHFLFREFPKPGRIRFPRICRIR